MPRLPSSMLPALVLALSAGGSTSLAQQQNPPPWQQPNTSGQIHFRDLRYIEAGRTDVNPLIGPGRNAPASLREPNDFRAVYQVPHDASSRYGGWFARVRGGVIAAFPRSEYKWVPTPDGKNMVNVAAIPTGTIFFLGGIPTNYLDDRGPSISAPADSAIDTSASFGVMSNQIDTSAAATAVRPVPDAPRSNLRDSRHSADHEAEALDRLRDATLRLFTDEQHRQRRLDALLSGAATLKQNTPAPPPAPTGPAAPQSETEAPAVPAPAPDAETAAGSPKSN